GVANEVAFYADHGVAVGIEIEVVDRAFDARPDALTALAWDDPSALDAIDATLDTLFEAVGGKVSYLSLGREADLYCAMHPADTAALTAFATHAVAHAHARASTVHAAMGVSLDGASGGGATAAALLALGDRVLVSYFPGLEVGVAAPVTGVAAAL